MATEMAPRGHHDCVLVYPNGPDTWWDTPALLMLQTADRILAVGEPPALLRALMRKPLQPCSTVDMPNVQAEGWTTWLIPEEDEPEVMKHFPRFGRRLITCHVGRHQIFGDQTLKDADIFFLRPLTAGVLHQGRCILLGANVWHQPLLEFTLPGRYDVDTTLDELDRYHWLVFTSAFGVEQFVELLRAAGKDLRALGNLKLAAIGPATAQALRGYRLEPDLVPAEYRSERLAEELLPHVRGGRVLLARSDRGRDVLPEMLRQAAEVTEVALYQQRVVTEWNPAFRSALCTGAAGYVLLTSSNIAVQFLERLPPEAKGRLHSELKLVSISPVTSAALRAAGAEPDLEAEVFTLDGMLEVIVRDRSADLAGGVPRQIEDDGPGEDAKDVEGDTGAGEGKAEEQIKQE